MMRVWLRQALLSPFLAAFALTMAHADEADNAALISAFNTSGYELFKQFVAAPGNVVFSPYSIGSAMAMISSGARGDTASQMALALHQQLDHDQMNAANARVLEIINSYRASVTTPSCQDGANTKRCDSRQWRDQKCRKDPRCPAAGTIRPSTSLNVANAVLLTNHALVSDTYVKRLKDDYSAAIFRNVRLEQVNDWISRTTEGRISHVLDRLPTKGIVLVDAIYFKQAWHTPFIAEATMNDDFHVSPTSTIKVAMMHRVGYFPLATGSGFRAIRLRYVTGPLSMVVVLPDTVDGATALAQRLDPGKLTELFVSLGSNDAYTDLCIPRFRSSFATELKSKYQQLGMLLPFDESRADFSDISGRPREEAKIWIDNVLHSTVLNVEESGTEAASATVTSLVEITSAKKREPPRPEPFTVDRPFLFYIADDNTGAILFAGRISDPSKPN
jgi:serpin B